MSKLLCPYVNLIDMNDEDRPFQGRPEVVDTKSLKAGQFYVGCGLCAVCKAIKAIQWGNRCACEAKMHNTNYFLTLTYDINPVNLIKSDLQRFIKRMRKAGFDFRYFACGEYGSKKDRPHFHVCAFGLEIPDLVFLKKSRLGHNYYISETIERIWGHGFILVSDFTEQTASYTASYTAKKYNKHNKPRDWNLNDEFVCMSLKPAIGYSFWTPERMYKYFTMERVTIVNSKGNTITVKPPRSLLKKYTPVVRFEKIRKHVVDCCVHNGKFERDYAYEYYDVWKPTGEESIESMFIKTLNYINIEKSKERLLLELINTNVTELEYREKSLRDLIDRNNKRQYNKNVR